ncbi:hypothetical protein [Niameybacter massiliensis]|uniref:hypothetical protein n=1 Tax=Niameybacter massiliensis TaxID=1658108 RepID=UPI0006B5F0B9|nr:hypothetical protein [Niameybacter massiliensis]
MENSNPELLQEKGYTTKQSGPICHPSATSFCSELAEILSSIASVEEDLGDTLKSLACSLDKVTTAEDVIKILNTLPDTIYALILLEQATIRKLNIVCECPTCKACACKHHKEF